MYYAYNKQKTQEISKSFPESGYYVIGLQREAGGV